MVILNNKISDSIETTEFVGQTSICMLMIKLAVSREYSDIECIEFRATYAVSSRNYIRE